MRLGTTNKYLTLILLFILVGISNLSFAQTTLIESIKKQFPDELAVYLKKSEHLNIDIIHDSVIVVSDNYSEMLHLSDKSNVYAEKSFYESKFVEVSEVEAKTLVPTKKDKYETVKVSHFNSQNDIGGSIFYDDSKRTSFVFPNIKEGSRTILQYKETFREPRFLNAFYFSEHVGVAESELKVTFSSKIKIRFETFSINANQLEFSQTQKGNKTTYSWKCKNQKGYRSEYSSPSLPYYAPHIMIYVDEAEIKGKTTKYLSNVNELYNFFHNFVKDVNLKEDEHVKKVVDSLVNGVTDDLEKTKRIFYWVQDNIRYIAFEDGYGGFIPREACNIFQKRYGDCKDMASILTFMLKYAKVPAYLTWIGSRHIPYTFDKNAAPNSANHMIAAVKINGQYIYLDATGSYTRFGFPTDMIQGKQCIMAVSNTEFDKQFVPIMDKEKNPRYDSIAISIKGNTITGKGKVVLDGYSKLDLVYPLISKTEEKQKEILVGYLEKGNNKFFLENYTLKDIANRDKPLLVNYDFKVEDYSKTINNEIYINLNLDKHLHSADIDTATRNLPIERDYKYTDKFIVSMDIPAGFKINYVPENANYNNELFGFKIKYEVKNNKIIMTRNIFINALLVEKPSFDEWNKMIVELSKVYKEVVVLKK